MRTSKMLAVILPLALAGCNEFFGEDSDSFYAPPSSPVAAPATGLAPHTPKPATSDDCGCPKSTPIPSSALSHPTVAGCTPVEAAVDPEWFPSEGQLVRAGDQVMDLKRSKNGVYPSHEEMARHLVANMGVTAAQAEKILEELGL
jgi:hypothetical protein